MNITVLGLWHLGCVTAACCAEQFPRVRGLDFDAGLIQSLHDGQPPISEPGLTELLQTGLRRGSLSFTSDAATACADTQLLWVCYDTPVDDQDRADVEFVVERLKRCLPSLPDGAIVLISSQVPVGTCAQLSREWPRLSFAVSPENLQLGRALDAFRKADRIVIGTRDESVRRALGDICGKFTPKVLFMSPESAEMTKHALNSFLAMSVSFANEIARICERAGADGYEVEQGLKSDPRIGQRAYLKPGTAFAGGTLARDVAFLSALAPQLGEQLHLIPSIKTSNDLHKLWALNSLRHHLGELTGKTIALLGLTYKPGTDTLRRSGALELAGRLLEQGAKLRAFDPVIKTLPPEWSQIEAGARIEASLTGADAAVLCTPWPEFRQADWAGCLAGMRRPLLLDPQAFLQAQMPKLPGLVYVNVGRVA